MSKKSKELTVTQQRYIAVYDGNVRSSAKMAGISYSYAVDLHREEKYSHVLRSIKDRRNKEDA